MSAFVSAFQSLQSYFVTKRLPPPPNEDLLYLPLSQNLLLSTDSNMSTDRSNLPPMKSSPSVHTSFSPSIMYVTKATALLTHPVKQYDGCIAELFYGEAVSAANFQGRYVNVQTSKGTGWIDKDHVSKLKTDAWPTWSNGVWYGSEHLVTKQVRKLINDNFFAGSAGLPLQPAEFVSAVLLEDKRSIKWPMATGRTPGRWHQLLRGLLGVHIVVYPVTDSIMEWIDDEGVGHLAYVREVHPDKTLKIEGIGILEEEIFESVFLPEALWREWRPIFIEVW